MSDFDFAIEMPRRLAHLDQLPGKVYHEWTESLNRAARLFSKSSEELRDHLMQLVGKPIFVTTRGAIIHSMNTMPPGLPRSSITF